MPPTSAAPTKRVLLAKPRGYCAGVDRAVQTVEQALDHYGAPVYVRKQIVHNLHVVRTLEGRGAIFVDENDEVPEGAVVVFSAHGVAPEVYEQAAARQLRTIDATCPLVTKVHHEARRFAKDGYDILLIGHEGHEEVVGTSGEAPEHITLVDGPESVADARGGQSGTGRMALADHAVGRRDDADRRCAAGEVPVAAVAAVRRHLLRHPEPAGRGEDHRAAGRAVPRCRVGELLELGAHGRGRARGRCRRRASGRECRCSRRILARRGVGRGRLVRRFGTRNPRHRRHAVARGPWLRRRRRSDPHRGAAGVRAAAGTSPRPESANATSG